MAFPIGEDISPYRDISETRATRLPHWMEAMDQFPSHVAPRPLLACEGIATEKPERTQDMYSMYVCSALRLCCGLHFPLCLMCRRRS